MSHLLLRLPPLAPDYSGVASFLHDTGALIVIHDASGCTGTYTGYDEPRWFESKSPVFCSGLRERDAILGDDRKLVAKIQSFLTDRAVPFIAIVGSPVPMVVGFDFKGFAHLLEHETGLPAEGFATTGMSYYDRGQSQAYLTIARRFVHAQPNIETRGVNLLGASTIDGIDDPALDALLQMLEEGGLDCVSIWGARSSFETLAQAARAKVNWVLTAAALPLARHFQERFGTPFIAGLPIGDRESARLQHGLAALASGAGLASPFPPALKHSGSSPVLLFGEPLAACSMRNCLNSELGREAVQVASMFDLDAALAQPWDRKLGGEEELETLLQEPSWSAVIGDPLLRAFLPTSRESSFMPIPHRAISGRLHRDSISRLFHTSGKALLDDFLRERP